MLAIVKPSVLCSCINLTRVDKSSLFVVSRFAGMRKAAIFDIRAELLHASKGCAYLKERVRRPRHGSWVLIVG